ncbi:hypothetical protein FGG08_000824 [Glutinoglossum americanum]|uniref:Signal peptidase complex subunit 2 n=1 Tax=Glutinoglossum americanum TaxID=1670608 RepID=A0A9P8L0U9_9PEZI|nr:hypothetical protein FGG08_000824 [Glutinoglossum americanum]
MSNPPSQIAVHSLPDLKNTTDDALPNYLASLKFKQSHRLTDVRLALSFAAFATAAVTFVLDYKFGFEAQKTFTTVAVCVYFFLNTALTYWIWGVERGKVYEGTAPNGTKVHISPHSGAWKFVLTKLCQLSLASYTEKHSPIYRLRVHTQKPGSSDVYTFHISAPFSTWFSADSRGMGELVSKPLQQWLVNEVPLIAEVDTAKGSGATGESAGALKAKDSGSGTGTAVATPSQGTRNKSRRK